MSKQSKLFEEELARRNPDWEKIVACHNDALAAERLKCDTAIENCMVHRRIATELREQLAAERARVTELEEQNKTFRAAQKACEDCDGPTMAEVQQLREQLAAEREVGHNQAVALGQQIARLEDQLAAAVEERDEWKRKYEALRK